jgi:hypothetical protein
MAKVEVEGETVNADVFVAPAAATVTVTAPAVTPVAVTLKFPEASAVQGEVALQDGASVTAPAPALPVVKTTDGLAIAAPAASFTEIFSVTGLVPLSGKVAEVGLTTTVEPTICTGKLAVVPPTEAVIVATRLD